MSPACGRRAAVPGEAGRRVPARGPAKGGPAWAWAESAAVLFVYLSHWMPVLAFGAGPLTNNIPLPFLIVFLMIGLALPRILSRWTGSSLRNLTRYRRPYYAAVILAQLPFAAWVISLRGMSVLVLALGLAVWHVLYTRLPRAAVTLLGLGTFGLILHSRWASLIGPAVLTLPFWALTAFMARRVGPRTTSLSRSLFFTSWAVYGLLLHVQSWPSPGETARVRENPALKIVVDFADPSRPEELVNANTVTAVRESCDGRHLWITSRSQPILIRYDPVAGRIVDSFRRSRGDGMAGDFFDLDCKKNRIFLPDRKAGKVWVLDSNRLQILDEVSVSHPLLAFYDSPADHIIIVDDQGRVGTYRVGGAAPTWSQGTHHRGAAGAALGEDGLFWISHGSRLFRLRTAGASVEWAASAPHSFGAYSPLDYCSSANRLVTSSFNRGRADVFDATTLAHLGAVHIERGIRFVRCGYDGRTAFIAGQFSGNLHRVDVKEPKVTGKLYVGRRGHTMAPSLEGRFLYLATVVGIIRIDTRLGLE